MKWKNIIVWSFQINGMLDVYSVKDTLSSVKEAGSSSDRFERKTRKAVKRRAKFRQVKKENKKSCQKNSQVQTGLRGKREKLSEEELTSDRFERKTRKAVRSRGKFRQV